MCESTYDSVLMSAVCNLILRSCTACANLPFLELGTTPGLRPILLPAEDDGISEAVSPPKGFPIWGTFYSDFYVSEKAITARLWMQGIDIVLQPV